MKISILLLASLFSIISLHAQSKISGVIPNLANQPLQLIGFSGFDTYVIDHITLNESGDFTLSYSEADHGMGMITGEENVSCMVVLNGEDITLKGEGMTVTAGKENMLYEQYTSHHQRREQALSAWDYLHEIYLEDSLFIPRDEIRQMIDAEQKRITDEDRSFLAGLPEKSYVYWYLPLRKLANSVSVIAQYRPEKISVTLESFRNLDYTDPRWNSSGLLPDIIESHFWLIENSGGSMDAVYLEMEISIDAIVANLLMSEQKLNETGKYLFNYLEKHSLFRASEYLATKLLNQNKCTLTDELTFRLENYRTMKMGNKAPEIRFTGDVFAPGYANSKTLQKLSDIKSQYTVVIFGASWCPQCPIELQNIVKHYEKWKQHHVEVVFISLDENKQSFESFTSIFPFISTCDYQKWESSMVKEWHVYATPTMYLLDDKSKIILKPKSVNQLDSWIDWYLTDKSQ